MFNIHAPWKFDDRGQTAVADDALHVRQLVESLLFTNPGERVNRPDFGCGLLQLVFEPNSIELSSALQATVQAAIHRWLGDVIELDDLGVDAIDSKLSIQVSYTVTRTGEQRFDTFERNLA